MADYSGSPLLARWRAAEHRVRTLACIGDSITEGRVGRDTGDVTSGWVDRVSVMLDSSTGQRLSDGFRGMWKADEWMLSDGWIQARAADSFDVAPFEQGFYSSGSSVENATWAKPPGMAVAGCDVYWFDAPDLGTSQFKADQGPWRGLDPLAEASGAGLHRIYIDEPVRSRLEIRSRDASGRPSVTTIAGIGPYATGPTTQVQVGTVVHNLGKDADLLRNFCRASEGDPLALLDVLRPELVTVMFSNDVLFENAANFEADLRGLIERVAPYADVLVIGPPEQRPPRHVSDAATTKGSPTVGSSSGPFRESDVGLAVTGTNIPADAVVVSVESALDATISAPAVSSCASGQLLIGSRRSTTAQAEHRAAARRVAAATSCAFLDLYEEWANTAGQPGWDAAFALGLMHDGLHPSQLGHDDIAHRVGTLLGVGTLDGWRGATE